MYLAGASQSPAAHQRFLEAVIVCDEYGDFLKETIPHTLRNVNDLVVVTAEDDKETQALCAKLDCRFVVGWNHKRSEFDKAKAINHGLAHLRCNDWLLHMDADIVLPDVFADWFTTNLTLNPDNIYGVDRFDCRSADAWDRLRNSDYLHTRRQWRYMIQPPPGCKPCTRVAHGDYEGWVPVGFFQLWHSKVRTRYSWKPGAGGEHTDLLHGTSWKPENRILIPDFYAIHLSTGMKMGENWRGRKSPRFRN
jgi:hypothetical protein